MKRDLFLGLGIGLGAGFGAGWFLAKRKIMNSYEFVEPEIVETGAPVVTVDEKGGTTVIDYAAAAEKAKQAKNKPDISQFVSKEDIADMSVADAEHPLDDDEEGSTEETAAEPEEDEDEDDEPEEEEFDHESYKNMLERRNIFTMAEQVPTVNDVRYDDGMYDPEYDEAAFTLYADDVFTDDTNDPLDVNDILIYTGQEILEHVMRREHSAYYFVNRALGVNVEISINMLTYEELMHI